MSSLHCAELTSRRMSIKVQAQTRVSVVRASDYGDDSFVEFLASNAQNPFMAHRIFDELDKLIKARRRLDDTLFQIYKMARYTCSKVENAQFFESNV